jgi:alpha-mannosidase
VIVATHYGEIYLESCRGCYTTQAKTKLNNRKAENLLRELELLATLASVYDPSYTYPKDAFDSMWQTILLCHFHDVIPGSAIEMVNDDASTVRCAFEIYHNHC